MIAECTNPEPLCGIMPRSNIVLLFFLGKMHDLFGDFPGDKDVKTGLHGIGKMPITAARANADATDLLRAIGKDQRI